MWQKYLESGENKFGWKNIFAIWIGECQYPTEIIEFAHPNECIQIESDDSASMIIDWCLHIGNHQNDMLLQCNG